MKLKVDDKTALIIVTWKEPECHGLLGIKGYTILYKTGNSFFKNVSTKIIKCCSYNVTKLKKDVTYYLRVVAVNAQGRKGSFSKTQTFKIQGRL